MAAGLALGACQRPPLETPGPRAEGPSVATLQAQGDAELGRRNWEAALRAYSEVLRQQPAHFDARYRVAVALSHQGRTEEATAAFQWVAQHGPADREETRLARQWLAAAGERSDGAPEPPAAAPADAGEAAPGRLRGRTEWTTLDPAGPRPRLQLLLVGDDERTRGRRYGARTALTEPYEFTGVVPGRYRLLAQVGRVRLWDLTVTVGDTAPTVVDLTPATSVAGPDALAPQT